MNAPEPKATGAQPAVTLPPDLANNPLLVRWIRFADDGFFDLLAGKVELGQGIATTQLQIAADELDIPVEKIRLHTGNTALCPDQGLTAGSLSTEVGGMALRRMCAEIRAVFVREAVRQLNVEPQYIHVSNGVFFAEEGGRQLSYHTLAPSVDLNVAATGHARPKPPGARAVAGTSLPRPDLHKKLFGAAYVHDLTLPGMLHGRMVRPPSYAAELAGIDGDRRRAVEAMPGVRCVMVDGRYIGVCAEREEQAIAAAAALQRALRWNEQPLLPQARDDQRWLRDRETIDTVVDAQGTPVDDATLAHRLRADYSRPFLAHASIGPSCGLAQWDNGRLTVWTHAQGSFPLRRELAALLDLPAEHITVIHADGAGCYGHNGADDAAIDAAFLARAAGRPVRLQWTREEEFAWAPFGSAMSVQIDAGLDAQGRIASWHLQTWSHTHVQRPGISEGLHGLAARHRAEPAPLPPTKDFPLPAGGGHRNAVPLYDLPARRIDYHLVERPALRTSALRALGAFANVFAIESCMDELAALAGEDPLVFRLQHLSDRRAIAVLRTVADMSGWGQPLGESARADAVRGRGIGFARYKNGSAYCAVVVEIDVTDRIVLDRVWTAVDAGEVVNPDGLINQMEGGILQAASWTLKESVQWDDTRVTTRTWDDYPVLRFDEVPQALEVRILPRPDMPPLGAGECAAGPTAAAIANALENAIGIRVRDLPLTPEKLEKAAQQQG